MVRDVRGPLLYDLVTHASRVSLPVEASFGLIVQLLTPRFKAASVVEVRICTGSLAGVATRSS